MNRFPHTMRVLSTIATVAVVFGLLQLPLWFLKILMAVAVLGVLALALYADTRPKDT